MKSFDKKRRYMRSWKYIEKATQEAGKVEVQTCNGRMIVLRFPIYAGFARRETKMRRTPQLTLLQSISTKGSRMHLMSIQQKKRKESFRRQRFVVNEMRVDGAHDA